MPRQAGLHPQMEKLEFKGRVLTLTVLGVPHLDANAIAGQLAEQVAKAPAFFAGMPIILDCAGPDVVAPAKQAALGEGLVPVAVWQPTADVEAAAVANGLGVLRDLRSTEKPIDKPNVESSSASEAANDQQPKPPPSVVKEAALLIDQPVRSGQQIYARGRDLVITAAVSPGAEVIADGCIHIYGALRGRALAGAQGDETARIFCEKMEAELLAIAGRYRTAEELSESSRGIAAQVRLEADRLIIEPR